MKDGFYKVKTKGSESWNTIGELRTEGGSQWLYLIGFDEAMNPSDFIINKFPILI